MLKGTDEWFKSTQAGQTNKGKSNGSFLSTRSAIGAHSLEIVTHHARLQILARKGNGRDYKEKKMVSDRESQVWQSGDHFIIQSRYCDDPAFTLEQEKALHEIARSFLIVNRKRESDKRRKERVKQKKED
jgi:predicted urease superfamily metal-dependent hydrolase